MKRETVNDELGIKACGIGDLSIREVTMFLNQWEEGSEIGTLTLFYEPETGDLVLNKDNPNYSLYLDIAVKYLSSPADVRNEVLSKYPKMKDTLDTLEHCRTSRLTKEEIFRAENHFVENNKSRMVLDEILKKYNSTFSVFVAFHYGVMQGKRMERYKKRRSLIA